MGLLPASLCIMFGRNWQPDKKFGCQALGLSPGVDCGEALATTIFRPVNEPVYEGE